LANSPRIHCASSYVFSSNQEYLMSPTYSHEQIERIAHKRASAKLGWLIHAGVYVAVNALLIGLSLASGKAWAVFPLLGWGIGLAAHGAGVWLVAPGAALHERLLARERLRLAPLRDPW
jgi:2TM domain